jgi:DNA-binding transcriptional regulator YiaG
MTTLLDEALAQASAKRDLPAPTEARRVREAAGLTQQQIGDVIGVDRATVCRWESGVRSPRGPAARLYLTVLKRAAQEAEQLPASTL